MGACSGAPSGRRSVTASSGRDSGGGINEDVLARLKAAEEEAAQLRKELAAAQGDTSNDLIEATPKRVDSSDSRENLFELGKKQDQRVAWLSESDVDFFTGGAPVGETASRAQEDPEVQATVQKRLVIGGLITAALTAFAFVPTQSLRLKPPKPMYFYIVPLLRIQGLLGQCKPIIEDADWATLRIILPRVAGPPNNARENMDNVIALIDDGRTAERAQTLSAEFFEYLTSIDYNKYFDAMPTKALTGAQNQQYSDFSGKALVAALQRLDAFLSLLPRTAIADAKSQLEMPFR